MAKTDPSYVLVCMPINKAAHLEQTFSRITKIFEPEKRVIRIENIPGDWAAVFREHIANASLICFDMSRLNNAFNPNVLRELNYITTMILDWQAEHDIAPMFLLMHRDNLLFDKPPFSYVPAHEIDQVLCAGERSSDLNSVVGKRSVCVCDYDDPEAMAKFEQRLFDLKTFITSPSRPPMFNLVVEPYDERHPILKSATWASGFVPYYLRDEQYDGFQLANTSLRSEPDNRFWDNIRRVFRFSDILRHHMQLWLSVPEIPTSVKYNLLTVIRSAMDDGYMVEYGLATALEKYVEIEQNQANLDLAREILIPQESDEEFGERFLSSEKPARYSKGEAVPYSKSLHRELISVAFPTELAKTIRFKENENWAAFFPFEDQPIHKRILSDSFFESRYFAVAGVDHAGLFEDALDSIGDDIRETVRQMTTCRYTEHEIELTVRTTIVIVIVKLLLKHFEQGKTLLKEGDSDNILEIIWGVRDLYRFEFQSSALHRVMRAYIPWKTIREKAMRYVAREAARIIDVQYEEMYERIGNDEFPPAQVWGMLLCTQLFTVCSQEMLREWWVKYAIPEYLQRGEYERLIIDPGQINRWAPEQYA